MSLHCTFFWITDKTNHIKIPLTGTDYCNSKLNKFTYYFQYFRKIGKTTTVQVF